MLDKVESYFTHAGLPSGIVEIERGQVKGLEPGKYLNDYQESGITGKPGDISKFNEYYTWALGKEKLANSKAMPCWHGLAYPGKDHTLH